MVGFVARDPYVAGCIVVEPRGEPAAEAGARAAPDATARPLL